MALPIRDDEPQARSPWATWMLMSICVIVFCFLEPAALQNTRGTTIAERSTAYFTVQHFVDKWGMVPCEVTHLKSMHDEVPCSGFAVDRPERYPQKSPIVSLLTSLFLHGGILHLVGNMLFLWVFGRAVEDRLGSVATVLLFVLGGVVASLGYVALDSESTRPLVGASGAIAVIMGVYLVIRPRQRILSVAYVTGLQVVYLPAWAVLGLFFVTQFFTPGNAGVAWEAHVVGMVFGVAVGLAVHFIMRTRPLPPPAEPSPPLHSFP